MHIECWTAGPFQDDQDTLLTTLKGILTSAFPNATFRHVDVCNQWLHPLGKVTFQTGVPLLREWLPSLLAQLQQQPDLPHPWLEPISQAWDREALAASLATRPDHSIFFCCHPIATLPLLLEKQRRCHEPDYRPPLLVWLTNHYQFQLERLHPGISAHIVPHPAVAKTINQIAPERPVLSLPRPLHHAFDTPPHRAAQKQQLQLDQTTILVRADQLPQEDLLPLFFQISLVQTTANWLFYYGTDEALAGQLRQHAAHTAVQARMFGHQDHLQPFLSAADWTLCRPTPQTIAESLRCHTPMLFWKPLPGTEAGDAEHLHKHGIANIVQRTERAGVQLEQCLSIDTTQQAQQAVAHFSPHPQPPSAIYAKVAQELLQHRAEQQQRERLWLADMIGHTQPASPSQAAEPSPTNTATQTTPTISQPGADKVAWKEAYADVLLEEKQLQRALEKSDEEIAQWEERLDLAESHDDRDLIQTASTHLKACKETRKQLSKAWRDVHDRKEVLKKQPGRRPPTPSSQPQNAPRHTQSTTHSDPSFKELELDSELARLKEKMKLNRSRIDLSKLTDEEG